MKQSIIAIFCLVFALQTQAGETINPTKKQLIDTLLEQTGQSTIGVAKQFSDVFIQQMTMVLKNSKPEIDPRAYDIMADEIKSVINEEMLVNGALSEMIHPIYSKHFSVSDLQKMIEFNNTELGKKLISVMPMITQESIQVGQQWGQSLGPIIEQRLMVRFEQEGIE